MTDVDVDNSGFKWACMLLSSMRNVGTGLAWTIDGSCWHGVFFDDGAIVAAEGVR